MPGTLPAIRKIHPVRAGIKVFFAAQVEAGDEDFTAEIAEAAAVNVFSAGLAFSAVKCLLCPPAVQAVVRHLTK